MKPKLLQLALSIYDIVRQHSIQLHIEWIPRAENVQADFFSRVVDYDDWGVKPEGRTHGRSVRRCGQQAVSQI